MAATIITRCLEADSTGHSTDRFWPFFAYRDRQKSTRTVQS